MIAIHFNHRQARDSRIRTAFKDGWKHDMLRVKDGVTNCCVIGGIDSQAQFQRSYQVPDGFEIDFGRRVLPAGENE